jgi:hypothetical protein
MSYGNRSYHHQIDQGSYHQIDQGSYHQIDKNELRQLTSLIQVPLSTLKNEGREKVKKEVTVQAKEQSQSMITGPLRKKPHLYANEEEAPIHQLKHSIQNLPLDELYGLNTLLNKYIGRR